MGFDNSCCQNNNEAISQEIISRQDDQEFVPTGSSSSSQLLDNIQSTLILPPLNLNLMTNFSQVSVVSDIQQPVQVGFIPPINCVQQFSNDEQVLLSDRLSDISKIDHSSELQNRTSVIQECKNESCHDLVSENVTSENGDDNIILNSKGKHLQRPIDGGLFGKPFLMIKSGRPTTPE